MQGDRPISEMTSEEREKERRRLWRAYRKAKAEATDARSMMRAAEILGRVTLLESDRPSRRRRAP